MSETHFHFPRRLLIIPISLSLLLFLCLALAQFTEIDSPVVNALRENTPAGVKEMLRPLRAPQVLGFEPKANAQDVSPQLPITIYFLTPMSPNDAAIKITPEVKGAWSWSGSKVTFTPSEPYPLGATVTVTVTRDARSWLLRRAEKELAWSFNVLAAPAVMETSPKQGARFGFAKDGLSITFNREMDRASVESRLVVAPQVTRMKLEWQTERPSGKNKLFIRGDFRANTNYRVIITSGAKDAQSGLTMPSEFVWNFTTTQQHPYLAIVNLGRYGVTAAEKPTTLKLQMTNVSRIEASLYQLDTPTYLQTLSFSYDRWRNFKPKGAPIKTWTLTPAARIDQSATQDLQLDALPSGFYYLVTQSPEGVFDSQVLVATKIALTLKRTADQALVWATNLADGAPVENLQLAFYNSKGETIGAGTTNKDGLFLGTIKETREDAHLIATRGNESAAVSDEWSSGIEPWRFDGVQWQWNPQKRTHRIYIYSDRPIYRPGQTVYFKGIVRKDDDGAYAQPPTGTEVRVKVSDWQERVLYDKTLKTSAFGSLADSFTINAQAGLGTYQIVARIGDEEYRNEIRVEEYRKPEFSVGAKFDREAYINGDAITATIHANYFFGGPVANARVRWTLYSNDYYFYWSGGEMDFGAIAEQKYFGYGREVSSDDATLNANGELVVKLPANITSEQRSQIFTLEATITDAADQPQSALATAIVHRGNFYIGLRPANYVAEKNKEARFDAQTLDTQGKPFGRVAVNYTLNLVNWNCYRAKNDRGFNIWKCDEVKTEIQSGDFTTDASGKYRLAFTPPRGGAYRLQAQARDARGNRVLGETWLWVSDREQTVAWRYENNDRIELVLDKKVYNVGDTVQVLIKSPYPKARALVTVERGKIISHQVISLSSNSSTYQLPITADYYPNVYVSVLLIPDGASDGLPSFKMGVANLKVASNTPLLDVLITPLQARYSPREIATYQIKTRDASGKPVSAELSLAIVDKAVLALASETGDGSTPLTTGITQAFYGTRDLAVRTAQSLAVYVERVNLREDLGGGGGAEERARSNFLDVAFWSPTVTTDANGDAKAQVELPDNLTTWSAIANAVTAQTQVGKASADTLVTKDLIVRPVLPRFFTVGDKVNIGTVVNNSTTQTQTVSISLAATNLTLPVTTTQSVTIAPNQSARVSWDIVVPSATTLARTFSPTAPLSTTITIRARGTGVSDAVQLSLPIEPFGEKRIIANAGQVEESETSFKIQVPSDANFATLKLETSPSLAASLLDSIDYLTGFPYGCVEQTMSKFLPSVLVKQTLDKLQIQNPKIKNELPRQVEEGLNRLYAFQHSDGGWGWWEGDESLAWETAYVTYGLLQAKRAGYAVDAKTIERALKFMKTPLVETKDDNLKVYIAYVIAEAGQGDAALARARAERQSTLTLESRAFLALLLNSQNETARAKTIVDDLKRNVIETAQHAHWEDRDVSAIRLYMGSNGRTTATILRALLALDRDSPLVPKTVRYLMIQRIGGYWRTTQETAQVLIALTEYLAQTGELDARFSYEMFVDGASVAKEEVSRESIAKKSEIALRLGVGEHTVRIARSGAGRLYYASAVEYYRGAEAVGAIQSLDGPTVRREYLDPKTDATKTSFRVGDIVRVRLTVDMPREGWYMMVTDPLPAGFEAINYTLNTSGIEPTGARGARYYWSRPDLRDNRAVFFTTYLWKGKHTFTYLIRAMTSGAFRALPTEATPMYEPEVYGRSASAEAVVK